MKIIEKSKVPKMEISYEITRSGNWKGISQYILIYFEFPLLTGHSQALEDVLKLLHGKNFVMCSEARLSAIS